MMKRYYIHSCIFLQLSPHCVPVLAASFTMTNSKSFNCFQSWNVTHIMFYASHTVSMRIIHSFKKQHSTKVHLTCYIKVVTAVFSSSSYKSFPCLLRNKHMCMPRVSKSWNQRVGEQLHLSTTKMQVIHSRKVTIQLVHILTRTVGNISLSVYAGSNAIKYERHIQKITQSWVYVQWTAADRKLSCSLKKSWNLCSVCAQAGPFHSIHTDLANTAAECNTILKFSPVRDWRSTPLEWLSITRDLDLGSGHTAYGRALLIDFYLHTKCHWNRKNFFLDGLTQGPHQVQGHVTQKLGQISKIRPDEI